MSNSELLKAADNAEFIFFLFIILWISSAIIKAQTLSILVPNGNVRGYYCKNRNRLPAFYLTNVFRISRSYYHFSGTVRIYSYHHGNTYFPNEI